MLANDGDPEQDPLAAVIAQRALHDTASLAANGSFMHAPGHSFAGLDSFSYRKATSPLSTESAFVILAQAAPSQKPLAIDNAYSSRQNGTLAVAIGLGLLANDWDAQDDHLSVVLARPPDNGRLNLAADGSFAYVPDNNMNLRHCSLVRMPMIANGPRIDHDQPSSPGRF